MNVAGVKWFIIMLKPVHTMIVAVQDPFVTVGMALSYFKVWRQWVCLGTRALLVVGCTVITLESWK